MQEVDGSEIDPFNNNSRILVCGYSHSGKSAFVSRLVRKYHSNFSKIIVLGGKLENLQEIPITYDDEFDPLNQDDGEDDPPRILMVFDDLIGNKKKVKQASEIFYRGRHRNISCIFITHNLFYPNPDYRMITLNATHFALFKCRDISQIDRFSRTILPKDKIESFLSVYKKEVLKKPFGYLFINITSDIDGPLAIQTDICKDPIRSFQL